MIHQQAFRCGCFSLNQFDTARYDIFAVSLKEVGNSASPAVGFSGVFLGIDIFTGGNRHTMVYDKYIIFPAR